MKNQKSKIKNQKHISKTKNKELQTPLTEEDIASLRVGDKVLISGVVYTARDGAHQRLVEAIGKGEKLPFDPVGQVIYYVGPSPARPGQVIGAAGPTTSSRMDRFTPPLLTQGIKGLIGKGQRSREVREALKKNRAVYFVATGGVGALLSKNVEEARVIAYPELGPEAVYELTVENLPIIVANDIYGGDIFEEGRKRWHK
jgi:fumarate hydratase subunit beta